MCPKEHTDLLLTIFDRIQLTAVFLTKVAKK